MSSPLNKLAQAAYDNAVKKGFYEKSIEMGTRLMLITSEISEALEADRKDKHCNIELFEKRFNEVLDSMPNKTEELEAEAFVSLFKLHVKDTFEDEIADAMIRELDLCGFKKIDIEKHIYYKMKFNSYREKMHGKKY